MQHWCMERLNRKRGPQVWQFRWSEVDTHRKRLYHKKIVGTVEHYPDETAVRRAVVGLLSEINADVRPERNRAEANARRVAGRITVVLAAKCTLFSLTLE
jgi:hypothetical protein